MHELNRFSFFFAFKILDVRLNREDKRFESQLSNAPPILNLLIPAVSFFRASNLREHFYFCSRFLCFQRANRENTSSLENPLSPETFVSRAKAPSAK